VIQLAQADGPARRLAPISRRRSVDGARPSILLVKTSSLGDVVANLPVVADILRWRSDACIDWVVEETYADLVRLHPGVREVIVVAQRRWRKGPLSTRCRGERQAFVERLRSRSYDIVVDTQGLLKSAIIAWRARGSRVGYDWSSARESPATLAYQRRIPVPTNLHAIDRNRRLVASALGYRIDAPADYGLRPAIAGQAAPGGFWVAVHGSSREEKLWPEMRWSALARGLASRGLSVVLPWGSEAERMRSERLKQAIPGALVPLRLGLRELAGLLRGARFVAGVDSGPTHLAAALGVPVVALFSGSDPRLSGVRGKGGYINLGAMGRAPEVTDVVRAVDALVLRRNPDWRERMPASALD
jgi:heptosyltransferase-1